MQNSASTNTFSLSFSSSHPIELGLFSLHVSGISILSHKECCQIRSTIFLISFPLRYLFTFLLSFSTYPFTCLPYLSSCAILFQLCGLCCVRDFLSQGVGKSEICAMALERLGAVKTVELAVSYCHLHFLNVQTFLQSHPDLKGPEADCRVYAKRDIYLLMRSRIPSQKKK